MLTTKNELFDDAFAKARPIEFDKAWSNGTGYFDYATDSDVAPKVGFGGMVKCTTPGGRRILIIGTRIGNCVIFDRYSDDKSVFVFNMPTAMKQGFAIDDGAISNETMLSLVGDGVLLRNIGNRLDDLYKAIKIEQGI